MVSEWGISNTTLEEVFLRLVAANNALNGNIDEVSMNAMETMAPSQQLLQALKWADLSHLEPILALKEPPVTLRDLLEGGIETKAPELISQLEQLEQLELEPSKPSKPSKPLQLPEEEALLPQQPLPPPPPPPPPSQPRDCCVPGGIPPPPPPPPLHHMMAAPDEVRPTLASPLEEAVAVPFTTQVYALLLLES